MFEELVEHALHAEDLFFADAQEVVVIRRAFDDGSRGVLQAGGFIHDDRRIPRPRDDRALSRLHRRPRDGRAARDHQQRDAAMIEELLGGFQRRRHDAGDKPVDPVFRRDLFVVFA